ncbi:DUF2169 family type VI secretion system accessory protein [Oryzifoliimicrobium ureilyticus]|uniref:DUF2169 family type VI secretion system accessory protein n=1 Tax=Oryzifoliimicrobium ureilyticus TaxID=3113724 RepID=UPI003076158B
MKLDNRLPFPALAFRQFDMNGDLDCVVSMRATFLHRQDEVPDIASEQEPFHYEDVYGGDPHKTPLLKQSDLTPEKPGTDVTYLGTSWAPGGQPSKSWVASIKVGDLSKEVGVCGERFWHPVVKEKWAGFKAKEPLRVIADWKLSEPAEVLSVPICWSKAFGGEIPGTADEQAGIPIDVDRRNPLGCGIVSLEMPHDTQPVPAPQITKPGYKLDWKDRPQPEAFGPMSPWWITRHQYAGTYDGDYVEKRHPLLPEDFDARFWMCAHPDLACPSFLKGDEAYELTNLDQVNAVARGRLPDLTFGVRCQIGERDEWTVLRLDGIHFDWRNDNRIVMTWRARFPLPEAVGAELTLTRVSVKSRPADNLVGETA